MSNIPGKPGYVDLSQPMTAPRVVRERRPTLTKRICGGCRKTTLGPDAKCYRCVSRSMRDRN